MITLDKNSFSNLKAYGEADLQKIFNRLINEMQRDTLKSMA
jgi:hypothetical protein